MPELITDARILIADSRSFIYIVESAGLHVYESDLITLIECDCCIAGSFNMICTTNRLVLIEVFLILRILFSVVNAVVIISRSCSVRFQHMHGDSESVLRINLAFVLIHYLLRDADTALHGVGGRKRFNLVTLLYVCYIAILVFRNRRIIKLTIDQHRMIGAVRQLIMVIDFLFLKLVIVSRCKNAVIVTIDINDCIFICIICRTAFFYHKTGRCDEIILSPLVRFIQSDALFI